jgi:phospholipid/cholesterol/gamma-HCH transport system permease protein
MTRLSTEAEVHVERVDDTLRLVGDLGLPCSKTLWSELHRLTRSVQRGKTLEIDLGEVRTVDGAIMSLLVDMRSELAERNVDCRFVDVPAHLAPIVHLFGGDEPPQRHDDHDHERSLERVGRATLGVYQAVRHVLMFVGDVVIGLWRVARRRAGANWRALPQLIERAGADGVPIVLLLNFLVGFVMGFQSARQLQLYGANAYVADVVGISVTRELAPLMTAIIMSGRSGAAYAAELGTMRVSEEIDALRTMGLSPVPYLILPRIIALAAVAPVLTLLGDLVGIGGGAIVAQSLGISPRGYLAELRTAVIPSDVWTGLAKSIAFGAVVASIGCQQGFATQNAAAGVGRSTTATVVLCLFAIVIIDTIFTMGFRVAGE